MVKMPQSQREVAYFISDAHLGDLSSDHNDREERVLAFLRRISGTASHLFILGDFFDFWIEYKHAIRPVYFPILHELRKLIENGTEVHYLAGNHDFALGSFLFDYLGINVHQGHLDITVQEKKLHLHHGDGLLKFDFGYRVFSFILRNKFNQRLYRLLHPNIGVPLAIFASGSSRHFNSGKRRDGLLQQYRIKAKEYIDTGSDIVVFGHTHSPEKVIFENGVYCNTGDWFYRYTYAMLESGNISMWADMRDKSPQLLEPISFSN